MDDGAIGFDEKIIDQPTISVNGLSADARYGSLDVTGAQFRQQVSHGLQCLSGREGTMDLSKTVLPPTCREFPCSECTSGLHRIEQVDITPTVAFS